MKLSRFQPNKSRSLELSTTSMIDVVFLLLIFFLVTTTFVTPERQIKPTIKTEEQSSQASSRNLEPVVVDVQRENGVAVFRLGTTVSSDIEIIARILGRFPDKSCGAIVRLADDCPFEMAARAINQCRRSGFNEVSLVPGK